MFKILLGAGLAFTLGGCGYLFGDKGVFRDTSEDYKRAPEVPVIDVPAGKDGSALQEIYPIPDVEQGAILAGEFEVPRPTPLVAGDADQMVRIQRLGDDQWALVAQAPGQVWPQVRSFLTSAGIAVARVDARAGIMETGWLELQSQPVPSRFRIRIDQGVQRGTSELHVLQMMQAGDVQSSWPARSDNPDQESEFLQAVAQYLANSADTAQVSMVAEQAISASGKISLQETQDGEPYIALDLPYDRAWASVARSLEKSTFEITDRDRSSGEYFAVFLGRSADEEDGWFDWLWSSDEDQPHVGETFIVSVSPEGEDAVTIRLRPQDAAVRLDTREQQALLALIKGNIN
jgi:outer membrane protein assembly factor BamC